MKKFNKSLITCLFITGTIFCQKILIPMDQTQNDHLKSYGIAFYALKRNINVYDTYFLEDINQLN